LANIISIATAVPEFCHAQNDILEFMQEAFELNDLEKRKLSVLYTNSGIKERYSVMPDFSLPKEFWSFISADNKAVGIDKRMKLFKEEALALSLKAILRCIDNVIESSEITHLITVSCTGMSAPGLDLEIVEALKLPNNIFRTSVNFMGCYAAIHALKLAKMLCDLDDKAKVVIVSTELCTIHFQQEYSLENAASSLLFADGSAAVLLSGDTFNAPVLKVDSFYSKVAFKGKQDMAWQLSSKGFLMTLSSYIPQLIEEDIGALVEEALASNELTKADVSHWCFHPGGRKILDAMQRKLELCDCVMAPSRNVLYNYGNMSSPTVLFVLKSIIEQIKKDTKPSKVFGVAFGPGLTMETFIASTACI
jgi:predicted naringenin-chalcone synthase